MKQMLSQSPVAAYFWATTKFYSYSAGLFSCPYDPTMSQMNHGVMIFGYDANGNYYLKNSWGVRWGYQGYAIINKDYDCGIRKIVIQLSDGTSTNRLAYNPACSSIISQLKAFTSNYASTLWISVWLVLLMIIFIWLRIHIIYDFWRSAIWLEGGMWMDQQGHQCKINCVM